MNNLALLCDWKPMPKVPISHTNRSSTLSAPFMNMRLENLSSRIFSS